MLYEVPRLDARDRRVLAEIDRMREELSFHVRPVHRWDRQLRRHLTARAIAGSTTIEGYVASVSDVEDLMIGAEPLETDARTVVEVDGYRQAMTYVQRLARAGPGFAYSHGLLNGLHFMMQGHHLKQGPGWWRTGPVWVTDVDDPTVPAYTAPDAELVPGLADDLVDWLNEGDLEAPALVRAAMAHLILVKIHPWRDGNGRMSRALQTLVLGREGLLAPEFSSIEEWLGRSINTLRYYDVLRLVGGPVWSPENDTRPWIRFCLRAHHEQVQLVVRRVEHIRVVWGRLEGEVERLGYPERMMHPLFAVTMGYRVRRATYQVDGDIGEQAAQRDLRRGVHDGWLVPEGEARDRYYTAGPSVPADLIELVTTPRPLIDPYEDA